MKFFRKIRQKLLSEKRIRNYLLYAIGEISLVVIGILIALQINNWNQNRIDQSKETKYLINLQKELSDNIELSQNLILNRMERKLEGLKLAKQFTENELVIKDTLDLLLKISYGAVSSGGMSFGARNFYDELLNTGNLQLIRKDTIKISIADYYSYLDLNGERSKIHSSQFLSYISALRPFDSEKPNFISKKDQIEMIESFKSDEFRKLVDQELSYAYTIKRYSKALTETAESIIELIRKELEGEL